MFILALMQVTLLGLGCVVGCSIPNSVSAPPDPGVLAAAAPVVTDSACRTLVFVMVPASSTFPNFDNCAPGGMMLAQVPNGTMSLSMPRRISIALRIRNRTASDVSVPMRLVLPKTGIVIIGNGASTKVTPSSPDSLRGDGTAVWLVGGDGMIRHPGDSTAPKTIFLNVDNPVASARLTFQILTNATNTVPSTAPDSTPAWFNDDSSYTASHLLKRVLDIRFQSGATLLQKQAAIDSVGGAVIGGFHLAGDSDGVYTVYVPAAVSDSAILIADRTVRRQPGVLWAHFRSGARPSGLRPNDGTGWTKGDWSFATSGAGGDNWAMEDIGLPLGWGCQTEMPLPGLAVIDARIPLRGEFRVNSRSFASTPNPINLGQQFELEHGKWVNSLLASKGNDAAGGTGVLWRAQIDPFPLYRTTSLSHLPVSLAIDSLMRKGDSIIVIVVHPERFPNSIALDTANAVEWAEDVVFGMSGVQGRVPPLLIASAGNDNRDMDVTAFGRARLQLPNNILIVGASDSLHSRWGGPSTSEALDSGSNHGAGVNVYAPGKFVGVADLDSLRTVFKTGTSFAAPLVAGIAGLLKAFDSRLTPSELKAYIEQGADSNQVEINASGTGGPRYLVNAYRSLTLAAKRSGAPLCGNHVWVDSLRRIVIDRGTFTETAYTLPGPDTLGLTFTRHGGRRIDFNIKGTGSLYWGLDYVGSSWVRTGAAAPLPDSAYSGTTWSFFGNTHDGDSTVRTSAPSYGGHEGESSATFNVYVEPRLSSGSRNLYQVVNLPLMAATYVVGKRVAQTDSLGNFVQYNDVPSIRVPNSDYQTVLLHALATPFGDRALLALNYLLTTVSGGHWAPDAGSTPIGSEWSYEVWTTNTNTVSDHVDVWSFPWSGGSKTNLWSRSNVTIGWMGVAEGLTSSGVQKAVFGVGRRDHAAAQLFVNDYIDCSVEYANALTGVTLSSRTASPVTCGQGQIEIGTFAPIRGPLVPQSRTGAPIHSPGPKAKWHAPGKLFR